MYTGKINNLCLKQVVVTQVEKNQVQQGIPASASCIPERLYGYEFVENREVKKVYHLDD